MAKKSKATSVGRQIKSYATKMSMPGKPAKTMLKGRMLTKRKP